MAREFPDRLKNFFNELETRRTLLTAITETHNKLINSFISIDETLSKKSDILDTEIENFKRDTEKTLEGLKRRENSIPEKEATLAANVEQLKASAIAEIERGEPEGKTTSGLLKMWFRRMDSKGLVNFLLAKRKEAGAVRYELTGAPVECVDLLGFVLDAVEEYVEMKLSVVKVKWMADRRWAFGTLIQAALPFPPVDNCEVATSLRQRAMAVLEVWKGVLGGGEGSVEATVFLQMVIWFGLKHKFDDEFLMKLVSEFATRKDMAKLAIGLGFRDKMKDIIEELVTNGKEIEAVYFACEGGLTDQFPPVPLLKSSIRRHRIITEKLSSSMDDVINEMSAIRSVIKCIEDQKLESDFPTDSLHTRLNDLDRKKARKKVVSASTTSNKRSRGGGGSSRPPKYIRLAMAARQNNHPAPPPPPPSAASFSAPYSSYGGQSPVRYGLQHAYPPPTYQH